MNILELDSYNLADAVKFNEKLNPRIWQGEKMKPQVRAKLLQIAEDFKQSLGLSDLEVKDITVSGSNAGYTYTPNSDIDLHLVVDLPQADASEVYRELFDAKKFQYNETHNITIGGYDVELYVENANQPPVSQGMYSVVKDDWINIPKKRRATVDDNAVKSKYEVIKHRIDSAIASKNFKRLSNTAAKIKKMRQAGLDKHGELGPENLAYKMLRTQGKIKALYDARTAAQDKKLSLKEQPKQRVTYGFAEDVGITPDGVSPSTKMFVSEGGHETEQLVTDFIQDTAEWLGIEKMPVIELHSDPEWGEANHSFGRYDPDSHTLHVNLANRHIMDILRTTAHELTHCKQHENDPMPHNAGDTGSPWENEAHAIAGIIMRHYADKHPELFSEAPEITESASGYIPKNKKEAKDPRWEMALTVDIKPGQVGKEANKLGLQTDKQGKPALLMKTANTLAESLARELELFEEQDLMEIKMTGKNLSKLASEIKGVKVGLEFEMIVPNAEINDDDGDLEPDYDQDERVDDIDDCVRFFDDGGYNGRYELQRLESAMNDDYQTWKFEQLDNDWNNNGFEYFQEWLDNNDPYDRDEGLDDARDYVAENNPNLEVGTQEYEEAVSERLNEQEADYAVQQWEAQNYNYDRARSEFDDEHSDDYSEREWLREEGIRYASDVESNYSQVTWPYYRSSESDGEADIERIALEFMNESGLPYNSVAVSSSYHGSYKKWVGNGWVNIGSEKPDDCFSIEPDGSLDGNDPGDAGLEFVSPPIPLEQVGEVMSKVQQWAGANGVYTGKANKTSMHTNISIPGYSIDKLDYLKAALLLGDEHVLRQFDRIGNTYAKPAIEKIKQLVNQKPEKAQELLDKMKSHLNAEASKLIHSGQTDKFTSINTKNNRIEFRSPGGDYLSDIADNPKKMQDMVNRMVVALDAAMDPNKYKEEYQKKLYKVLTSQQFGREAKSGAKQEPKKDTNDLLNIFSRYAAGELPKAALKSFVRQAQTERKLAKGNTGGEKYWWNVQYNNQRMEVVATNKKEAKEVAAKEWGLTPAQAELISSTDVKALRPYEEQPGQAQTQREAMTLDGHPSNPNGNYVIVPNAYNTDVAYRFQAAGAEEALAVLRQWRREYPSQDPNRPWVSQSDPTQSLGQPGGTQQPAVTPGTDTYRITTTGGGLIAGDEYGSDQAALERAQYWAQRRGVDVVVRNQLGQEIGRVSSSGDITPTAQQQPQTQQSAVNTPPEGGTGEGLRGNWGFWMTNADRFAAWPGASNDNLRRFSSREAAQQWLDDARAQNPRMRTDIEIREIEPTRTPVSDINLFPEIPTQQQTQFGDPLQQPNWEIQRDSDNQIVHRFHATNQDAAIGQAADFARMQGWDLNDYTVQAIERPAQQTSDNWSADFERRMQQGTTDAAQGGIVDVASNQVGQTYTPTGSGSFTGQWLILDPNNTIIYKFGGIGNSQSDANRHAMNWLTRNPRQMVDGVTVVPEMG